MALLIAAAVVFGIAPTGAHAVTIQVVWTDPPLEPFNCGNAAYAKAHADECVQSPFLLGGGTHKEGGGGLLGAIGRALGIL